MSAGKDSGKPSGFRSKAATVRPCAAPPFASDDSGNPSAVRPCAASGLSAVRPWRTSERRRKRAAPFVSCLKLFYKPFTSCRATVRPCRKRPPVPANVSGQGFAAGFRQAAPPDSPPSNAATVGRKFAAPVSGRPFDRVPPDFGKPRRVPLPMIPATVRRASLSGKPSATIERGDRAANVSGQR